MNRPLIAIPMGDAAGIGPEIVLKTIADAQTQETARCVVIGDQGAGTGRNLSGNAGAADQRDPGTG